MSLLTKASLILTPNAFKTSKLYSIVPSSGNGDMTAVRATTATRVNSSGLVELVGNNIPRLNYDANGSASILLEPQRTNLLSYSSTFTDNAWVKVSTTAVLDSTILSPDGTANSYKISRNSVSANSYITKTSTSSTVTVYTFTVYAKLGDVSTNLGIRSAAIYPNRGDALFNLSTGTLIGVANGGTNTSTSGSIQSVGNGWYRCSVTTTFAGTGFNIQGLISPTSLTTISGYEAADGALSNAYVWGAQLEQGAYPTSYIPTTTIALTRNGDVIDKNSVGSDILNPSEGTFYAEIAALSNDLISRSITLSDGTDLNQVNIQFGSVSNIIRLDIYGQTGVGTTANYRSNVSVSNTTTFHKALIKWGIGGIFGFVNGVKYTLALAVGTGSGIPTALNRIDFKQWWGGNGFYGQCKGLQIYKTALTDAECISLTTL